MERTFRCLINAGKEIDSIVSISAADLHEHLLQNGYARILDVRKQSEYDSSHLVGAVNLPLDYIHQYVSGIDKNKTYYVHCAGGYRSMIFISLLKARGFNKLIDVKGGFKALKESDMFELTDYVRPSLN